MARSVMVVLAAVTVFGSAARADAQGRADTGRPLVNEGPADGPRTEGPSFRSDVEISCVKNGVRLPCAATYLIDATIARRVAPEIMYVGGNVGISKRGFYYLSLCEGVYDRRPDLCTTTRSNPDKLEPTTNEESLHNLDNLRLGPSFRLVWRALGTPAPIGASKPFVVQERPK